jgi:hypothetical protein
MRRVLVPIGSTFVAGTSRRGSSCSAISASSQTSGEHGGSLFLGPMARSRLGWFGKIVRN